MTPSSYRKHPVAVAVLFFLMLSAAHTSSAQSSVTSKLVRNQPHHLIVAGLTIDPISFRANPLNIALGYTINPSFRFSRWAKAEFSFNNSYSNIYSSSDFEPSQSVTGNTVNAEKKFTAQELGFTFYPLAFTKNVSQSITLKDGGQYGTTYYTDVNADQLRLLGLRFGIGGLSSWFPGKTIRDTSFFTGYLANDPSQAVVTIHDNQAMGNNLSASLMHFGLSYTIVRDAVLDVTDMKINGKKIVVKKPKREQSESEIYFDLLLARHVVYDNMSIVYYTFDSTTSTTHASPAQVMVMTSPTRKAGWRLGYSHTLLHSFARYGACIGMMPGIDRGSLPDNIYINFNIAFGFSFFKD